MANSFIDREFLLWLYWQISEDGRFELDDYGIEPVAISIEGQINLSSIIGEGFSQSIKSADLDENRDVLDAVKAGRIPDSMKLRVIQGQFEWVFTLSSNPLSLKSVKLPIAAEKEEQDIIQFRIDSITMLENILKALVGSFVLAWDNQATRADLKQFLAQN